MEKKNYPVVEGIYDHYKGGVYIVKGIEKKHDGSIHVIYRSLIFETWHSKPLDEWNENYTVESSPTDYLMPKYKQRFDWNGKLL